MPLTSILRKILDQDVRSYLVKGQYVGSYTLESGHDVKYTLRISRTNCTFTIDYSVPLPETLSADMVTRSVTEANELSITGFFKHCGQNCSPELHYVQTIWIDRNPTRDCLRELMTLGVTELGNMLFNLDRGSTREE